MIIKPDRKNFFIFKFGENEHKNEFARQLISDIKEYIPHGQRLWYKEEKCWKIHKDCFPTFRELFNIYLERIINSQYELF